MAITLRVLIPVIETSPCITHPGLVNTPDPGVGWVRDDTVLGGLGFQYVLVPSSVCGTLFQLC